MSKKYHIAVVGASGLVGQTMLDVIAKDNVPVSELSLFSSARSAGQEVDFKGEKLVIQELTKDSLKAPIQIAIFAAGGSISEEYAPIAAANGITVVDNSSHFRMKPEIPLIVPEINADVLTKDDKIISNPNCSTIQSVLPLAPLDKTYGIKRVVYSTYQAVSGAGLAGIRDLENKTTDNFPYPINETVIPQIDVFEDNGYTKEEMKMILETRKILNEPDLPVTATAVRVPIKFSHGVSINVELNKDFDVADVRQLLADTPGIVVQDEPENGIFPLQNEAAHKDEVFVGRIRRDESVANGLNLWVVADNVRKGAATNSVQIVEALIERDLV